MATAGRPGTDQSPPDAVGALTVTRVDAERLTVTWPAAGDDVGVVSYSVWLNGFFVASTQQPRAILPWFNDSSTHVVQVRALDAVGNVGASSPTLLVVRPSPSPGAATPIAGTENPGPSPAPRPTDVGEAETPNTEHTPAPPSGTQPVERRREGRILMTPTSGPLVVQSDKTLLLEVDHPDADACRMAIAPFAELERAPEHIHTYRLTPLGLWNARAAGHDAEQVVDTLLTYSRYPVPSSLLVDVADTMDRFGRLRLEKHPMHGLVLVSTDRAVLTEVLRSAKVKGLVGARLDDDTVVVHPCERGHLKQVLLKLGWPAEDLAGYVNGEAHEIALVQDGWELRPYQRQAADSFWHGGSGVVVLPCGAGKTIVGAASMAHAQATTLILVTNTVSARQWRDELLRRTTLTAEEIGEYSGARKEIRPVTIATYQVITTKRGGIHPHLELFSARDWGLVIYDEVHLLPAPVFRMTADLQARRRLGLTATLVREDGREGDVFSLIGPKRYDAPWKDIEAQGYIAPADCVEVRVTLSEPERMTYAVAEPDVKYRLASTAESKTQVVIDLVAKHRGVPILVIGQYVDQLEDLAARLDAPLITGQTTVRQRERLYEAFRSGEVDLLVVSKVANFSIDLPSAQVAIQVSGAFGSRQEEAQRLGRLLRPKAEGTTARFLAVVARDTVDADFAAHRQRFLAEQGYAYTIMDAEDCV